jgi:hypothetical protein
MDLTASEIRTLVGAREGGRVIVSPELCGAMLGHLMWLDRLDCRWCGLKIEDMTTAQSAFALRLSAFRAFPK